ncbi:hypothetical protein Dimus_030795, partial [Dionaea muscipula]
MSECMEQPDVIGHMHGDARHAREPPADRRRRCPPSSLSDVAARCCWSPMSLPAEAAGCLSCLMGRCLQGFAKIL